MSKANNIEETGIKEKSLKKRRQKSGSCWVLDSNQNPAWGRNSLRNPCDWKVHCTGTLPRQLGEQERVLLSFLVQVPVTWAYSFYENPSTVHVKLVHLSIYNMHTNHDHSKLQSRAVLIGSKKRAHTNITGQLIWAVSYLRLCWLVWVQTAPGMCPVSWSAPAATTQHHRLGRWNNRHHFPTGLEARPRSGFRHHRVLGRTLIYWLEDGTFFLTVSSDGRERDPREICGASSSKDTNPLTVGPHSYGHI